VEEVDKNFNIVDGNLQFFALCRLEFVCAWQVFGLLVATLNKAVFFFTICV